MTPDKPLPTVFADIAKRVVAIFLDLALILLLIAAFEYLIGIRIGTDGIVSRTRAMLLLAFLYFFAMPLTPLGGTLGKWICRIKLCDRQGRPLGWRASLLRTLAMLGWFGVMPALFCLTTWYREFGEVFWGAMYPLYALLPYAPVGFTPHRETLFDWLAGTMVVRYRADAYSIARATPIAKPGVLNTAVIVFFWG